MLAKSGRRSPSKSAIAKVKPGPSEVAGKFSARARVGVAPSPRPKNRDGITNRSNRLRLFTCRSFAMVRAPSLCANLLTTLVITVFGWTIPFASRKLEILTCLTKNRHADALLPRHPQLDNHPLVPFVIDREMAMEQKATVFLKVGTRHGLAPRTIGIERRCPQDDVLAVEGAVALADRHRRLPRVEPHGGEAIRIRVEAGDSGAGALRSVRIEEDKIGLQKLALLNHILLTSAFRHFRGAILREERLDDVPIARELREQLLSGARRIRRLILIVGLLGRCDCDCGTGNKQRRDNPSPHGRR